MKQSGREDNYLSRLNIVRVWHSRIVLSDSQWHWGSIKGSILLSSLLMASHNKIIICISMVPFISQDFIDAKLFSFSASRRGQFLYLLTQGTDEVNDLSEGTVQQRKCRIASSHLLGAPFFFFFLLKQLLPLHLWSESPHHYMTLKKLHSQIRTFGKQRL